MKQFATLQRNGKESLVPFDKLRERITQKNGKESLVPFDKLRERITQKNVYRKVLTN